ncbi:MAG: hypothetical protein IJ422_07285 [Oscillospiraceae bacterium]|nr:hypothetical protein [Oscillospiraceae bacterium]
MLYDNLKKSISLALALSVIFAVLIFQASAAGTDTEPESAATGVTTPVTSMDTEAQLQAIQQEMDRILMKYLGNTVLTEDEVLDIVNTMSWDEMEAAVAECNALEPQIAALSQEELARLEADYPGTETIVCFYEMLELAMTPSAFAATGTHTPVGGVTVGVSGATDNSMSSGAVTVTAKGSAGVFGIGASTKTATITVTNSGSEKATVAFDWTATSVNQLTIDGTTYTVTSGHFSKVMGENTSFIITITTAKNNTTNKLVMNNFTWTSANDSYNVIFQYDDTMGSVTVDNAKTDSEAGVSIKSTGATIKANPNSGYYFAGWATANTVDKSEGELYQTAISYDLKPSGPMTLIAVFVPNGKACFKVGNTLFTDLTLANNYAKSATATTKVITLVCNGTLPAGNYTIDSGVTLLIPFDDANTLYTSTPEYVSTYTKPAAYHTLTMADGAKLEINGAMSISAKHKCAEGSYPEGGVPVGKVGFVQMNSGSSITINNGGFLYAWGYITGDGSVTAKSGGTVYEYFQVMDFRGGTQTTGMKNNVFVLSQYYVQNIEVPLTLEAGAKEYAFTSMKMSLATISKSICFIGPSGSDAMFVLSGGSMTKSYDGSTDRLKVEVAGNLSISKVEIVYQSGIIYYKISTKGNVLDINGNISIILNSGTTTVSQDIALQPGAHITVGANASLDVPSGYSMYVYDSEQWGTYVHSGNQSDAPIRPLIYAPSRTYDRPTELADLTDASIMVKGTLDASEGCIYTTASDDEGTGGGALIEGTEGGKVITTAGTQTVVYQISNQIEDNKSEYAAIGITPAKLKNEDGTYLATADDSTATTHYYSHGVWHTGDAKPAVIVDAAVAATCTATGLTEGSHCSVCNEVLAAQEVVSALDHSYTAVVTEPTCTDAGYTTYTCSVCTDSYVGDKVAATGHVWADATCTVPKTCSVCGETEGETLSHSYDAGVVTTPPSCSAVGIKTYTCSGCGATYTEEIPQLVDGVIHGTSVRAGDNLDIYFYINPAKLEEGCDYTVKLVRTQHNDDDITKEYRYDELEELDGYKVVSYPFAAKEMTDTVSVTVYQTIDGEEIQISETKKESIASYARRALTYYTGKDAELCTALVDMLNYGTAAQNLWSYNPDKLANADLSEVEQKMASAEVAPENNTNRLQGGDLFDNLSATVTADSNLYFSFYFSGVPADVPVTISYTDHYGKYVPYITNGKLEETTRGGATYYRIDVTGLAIADGRQVINCKLGDTIEVQSSVQSYIHSKINQTLSDDATEEQKAEHEKTVILCKELMKFIDSATKYFH